MGGRNFDIGIHREKSSQQKPVGQKTVTCMEASSGSVDSNLFKPWSQLGVECGHNGWVEFYIGIHSEKSLKYFLLKNQLARKAVTCDEASSGSVDSF